jgi:NAD(P)-dependent dehydrogenase (short-subunit alcohol dehydrogenase family)
METSTVLITGGNRGIGYELVRQLAEKGYRVYAGMRDASRSAELLELAERDDLSVTAVELEVTEESQVSATVDRIESEAGVLDVLVNNAARFAHDEEGIEQTRFSEMLDVLAVNSVAPIIVTRICLPLLQKAVERNGIAKVVSVSSGASLLRRELPEPGGQYSYPASKATLNVYLQRLAADLKERGIVSIGMTPGFVLTDMTRAANLSPTMLPDESARGQIAAIEKLEMADAGTFYRYTGEQMDWFQG